MSIVITSYSIHYTKLYDYTDFHGMMDIVEELYIYLANEVCNTTELTYQSKEIHMGGPWARITMAEAVKQYAGVDYYDWKTDEDAQAAAKAKRVHFEKNAATKGDILYAFFDRITSYNVCYTKLLRPPKT